VVYADGAGLHSDLNSPERAMMAWIRGFMPNFFSGLNNHSVSSEKKIPVHRNINIVGQLFGSHCGIISFITDPVSFLVIAAVQHAPPGTWFSLQGRFVR